MLKGIAAAATGMLPQLKKQEATANNLANVATAGFKRDRIFVQDLARAQAGAGATGPDWLMPQTVGVTVDFSPGPMDETNNALDVAIEGDAMFVVSTPAGERYTRNGNFTLNSDGLLTTADGNPVLGVGGEIQLPPGTVEIAPDGSISVDGRSTGRLRLVRFADTSVLARTGPSLFENTSAGVAPEDDESSQVRQGFLERANVNTIEEMVTMITTFRFFEAGQKSIHMQDEALGRVVNELGRVPL